MQRRFSASLSSATRARAATTSLSAKSMMREAVANPSQARLFDTKRLIRKIGTLDERTYRELAKALALTLFPFLSLK